MGIGLVLLVLLQIGLYTCQSLFCRLYSGVYRGREEDSGSVYTVIYGLTVALLSIIISGFDLMASPQTVLFGITNGVMLMANSFALVAASTSGPYSFITICNYFGGILVPMIVGVALLGDRLGIVQIIAIAAMLASFVLMNYERRGGNLPRPSLKYYISCALLFVSNGLYSVVLDLQQRVCGGDEGGMMITVTFFSAALISLVVLLVRRRGATALLPAFKMPPKALVFIFASAVSAVSAINLLMVCLGLMSSAVILFTLLNGGVMLVSVLISFTAFRESPGIIKISGIILAFASFVVLSII